MERDWYQDKDGAWFYYLNTCWMARWLFLDDEWELIEEEPKQGDELLVQDIGWEDWWNRAEFVCFYKWKVLVTGNGRFVQYDIWRFPPKKLDVTLQEIADWKWVEKELINIIN